MTKFYIEVCRNNLTKDNRSNRCRKIYSSCYLGDIRCKWTHIRENTKDNEWFLNATIICCKVITRKASLTICTIRTNFTIINAYKANSNSTITKVSNRTNIITFIFIQVCLVVTSFTFSIYTFITIHTISTYTFSSFLFIAWWACINTISRTIRLIQT